MYVSVSTVSPEQVECEIASIIEASVINNTRLGITGAIIFTGDHFAQALEGDEECVRGLMKSIRADPRHRAVTVVHEDRSLERRFAGWSIAYQGQASYVGRPIETLLSAEPIEAKWQATQRVYDLMTEFAKP